MNASGGAILWVHDGSGRSFVGHIGHVCPTEVLSTHKLEETVLLHKGKLNSTRIIAIYISI